MIQGWPRKTPSPKRAANRRKGTFNKKNQSAPYGTLPPGVPKEIISDCTFQRTKIKPFRRHDEVWSGITNHNKSIRVGLSESFSRSSHSNSESLSVTQGSLISIEQMSAQSPCFDARRQLFFLHKSIFILKGNFILKGQRGRTRIFHWCFN